MVRYSTARARVEPGMSAANALGFMKLKLSDEMNDEIPYLCHLLLASGGFLCLPAATMYHYYLCYVCIYVLDFYVYTVA